MHEVFGFSDVITRAETACMLAIGGFAVLALVLTAMRALTTEGGHATRWTARRSTQVPDADPTAAPAREAERVDDVSPGSVGLRGRITDGRSPTDGRT